MQIVFIFLWRQFVWNVRAYFLGVGVGWGNAVSLLSAELAQRVVKVSAPLQAVWHLVHV